MSSSGPSELVLGLSFIQRVTNRDIVKSNNSHFNMKLYFWSLTVPSSQVESAGDTQTHVGLYMWPDRDKRCSSVTPDSPLLCSGSYANHSIST